MPRTKKGGLFAIIRLDSDVVNEADVTVNEVVSTGEEAMAEVDRLNATAPDGVRYLWQATRWIETGTAREPDS